MTEIEQNGVIVEQGPKDWQVLQRDAAGVAAITLSALEGTGVAWRSPEIAYATGATVALKLGRALRGKAVVHGAARSDPEAVPFDMGRMMPMLGFRGVSIG